MEKGGPVDALYEVVVWVVWQPGPGGNMESDHPGSGGHIVIASSHAECLLSRRGQGTGHPNQALCGARAWVKLAHRVVALGGGVKHIGVPWVANIEDAAGDKQYLEIVEYMSAKQNYFLKIIKKVKMKSCLDKI